MCEKLDSVFSHNLLEIRVPMETDYLGPCYSGFRSVYGMATALVAHWDTDGGRYTASNISAAFSTINHASC